MTEIYDVYHDESIEDAYWHGMLFVPRSSRESLLSLLNEARQINNYPYKISYKNIKGKAKPHHGLPQVVKSWTTIGIASLHQQKLRKYPPTIYFGIDRRSKREALYQRLDQLMKCKFIVFRERDNHSKMALAHLDNVEITFKMALKGALHYLFEHNIPIEIENIFIDGDEHYIGKHGRTFDGPKIVGRLRDEARAHISFSSNAQVIAQRSDHKKIKSSQKEEDSHLLQLCDILLGGVRFHSYCPNTKSVKFNMSHQCKQLLEHDPDNFARMKESRFFKGFSFSEAWLERQEWRFSSLKAKKTPNTLANTSFQGSFGFF